MFSRTAELTGESPLVPVSAVFLGKASVTPTSDGSASNKLKRQTDIPVLLAGPQLRCTEPHRIWVWFATCIAVESVGRVFDADAPKSARVDIGTGTAKSIELGRRLHVTLLPITVKPKRGVKNAKYATDKVLGYAVELTPVDPDQYFDGVRFLATDDVALGDWDTPTFVIPSAERRTTSLMHASCRKLHGEGNDAIPVALRHLEETAKGGRRPTHLLLTGDQIYSDDVHKGVLESLRIFAVKLIGRNETLPGHDKTCALCDPGDRLFVLKPAKQPGRKQKTYGFTAGDVAKNHLLALGEFYGMYLLAWSPDVWDWFSMDSSAFRKAGLENTTKELRKLLANISTYMIFDDHEITDDWNLTYEWVENNASIPMMRRIISNGMAAYAMMQAIGNDPARLEELEKRVQETPLLAAPDQSPEPTPTDEPTNVDNWHIFDVAMWSFDDWAYIADTRPPVIVLDTRTQRELEPALAPKLERVAGLLAPRALERLARHLNQVEVLDGEPVLIIAPAPVIGFAVEELQHSSANVDRVTAPLDAGADPEAWSFHPRAFISFLDALADSGKSRFIFLSGDVHYGFFAIAQFSRRTAEGMQRIDIVQMTSSSTHNAPSGGQSFGLRQVLNRLNNAESDVQVRLGWRSNDPSPKYHPSIAAPGSFVAKALGKERRPDFELRWRYMATGDHTVVADNNIGVVTLALTSGWVSQRLKTADGDAHFRKLRWNKLDKELGR